MASSVRLTALSAYWNEVSAFSTNYIDVHHMNGASGDVEGEGDLSDATRFNAFTAMMAIPSYMFLLLDSPLGVKPNRVLRYAMRNIMDLGLVQYAKASALLADMLLRNISSTGLSPEILGTTNPVGKVVFKELEYLTTGTNTDEKYSAVLQYALSVLIFLKKMPYIDRSFNATAFAKWLEVEERLETLSILEDDRADSLRQIIRVLCGSEQLKLDLRDCHFGPGQVADIQGATMEKKLNLLFRKTSWKTQRVLSSVHTTTGTVTKDRRTLLPFVADNDKVSFEEYLDSIADLIFVPKDLSTARSICKEPNDVMFVQQGLRHAIERCFISGWTHHFVDLKDQSKNREYARISSARQDCDTIDLSSASDSVHKDWLELFPNSWKLLLNGTRSTHVRRPDGQVVKVKKFAPMGSALCFPIECVVFLALAIQAYGQTAFGEQFRFTSTSEVLHFIFDMIGLKNPLIENVPDDDGPSGYAFRPISVYGDDIILDSQATESFYALLRDFGFVANHEKSFTGSSPVRESCGIYAYLGDDITPIRFRIKDESWNESLLALANRAGDYGYRALRYAAAHTFLEDQYNGLATVIEDGVLSFVVETMNGGFRIFSL